MREASESGSGNMYGFPRCHVLCIAEIGNVRLEISESMVSFTLGTRSYSCGDNFDWQISGEDLPVKPPSLFKYYSLSDYNYDALLNQYVYASHPFYLNDLLDCSENLLRWDSIEDAKALFGNLYAQIEELPKEDISEIALKGYIGVRFNECGILSLTSSPTNPMLWALYTGNKGVCVEFDYNKFPFKKIGPFPINYVKESDFNVDKFPLSIGEFGESLSIFILSNIKSTYWKVEDEWRLLILSPLRESFIPPSQYVKPGDESNWHNRKCKDSLDCVKSYTFGHMFFDGSVEIAPNQFEYYVSKNSDKNALLSLITHGYYCNLWKLYIIMYQGISLKRHLIQIIKLTDERFVFSLIDDNTQSELK